MQLGMIGLGRMGANMVKRLLRSGHEIVGVRERAGRREGGRRPMAPRASIRWRIWSRRLAAPRAIWLMVPASVVDSVIAQLVPLLSPGDIIIDGGNSHYHDDIRRADELAKSKIHYVDVGTSGGVLGLERGYCQMIGGEKDIIEHLDPIFATLAPGGVAPVGRRARRPWHGGAGLSALRRQRRRPLREDGPQRHRVRPDGGLRRRLQYSQARQHRSGSQGRRGCRNRAAGPAAAVPVLVRCGGRWPKCGAAAASSPRSCWI